MKCVLVMCNCAKHSAAEEPTEIVLRVQTVFDVIFYYFKVFPEFNLPAFNYSARTLCTSASYINSMLVCASCTSIICINHRLFFSMRLQNTIHDA